MRTEERENHVALAVMCFGDVAGVDIVPATVGTSQPDLLEYMYTHFNTTGYDENVAVLVDGEVDDDDDDDRGDMYRKGACRRIKK
jgi:hypothetical protein